MTRLCLLLLLAALAAPVQAAPDPYYLFSQARQYWEHQHYPALVEYRVAVDVEEGGKERVERYRSALDASDGSIGVDPISDWELQHPATGSGVNMSFLFLRVGKPEAPEDFIGVPVLSPAYSFGMAPFPETVPDAKLSDAELVAKIRKEFHDPNPRASAAPASTPSSSLREIATVVAYKRDYAISLVGDETVDGRLCYHLHLAPLHDPGRLRLRDLWIDQSTSATWKLIEALNFVDGPGTRVPWTVRFADIDGAHYVTSEEADAPMAVAGLVYTHTAVRFEDVRAVSKLDFRPTSYLPSDLIQEP
jgi:hypothetical protein